MRALPVCLALAVLSPGTFYGNPPLAGSAVSEASATAPKPVMGYIGVATLPVHPALWAHVQTGAAYGLLVDRVVRGSPADHGAVQRHDILLKFNGLRIETQAQFSALVAKSAPGTDAILTVLHAGKEAERRLKIGATPQDQLPASPEVLAGHLKEVEAALRENPAAIEAIHGFLFQR